MVSKPKSTKVKSKPIKSKPKSKSVKNGKPKSTKVVKDVKPKFTKLKSESLPEKENSSLKKSLIAASTLLASSPLAYFMIKEAYSHYKENYGISAVGNIEQYNQYKKDRIHIENALNKPYSFKKYMEESKFNYRLNYIQDENKINQHNNSIPRPKQKIKYLYEYILHAKNLLNIDPNRPHDPNYYKSTENLTE